MTALAEVQAPSCPPEVGAAEIAAALGLSVRHVNRQAKACAWPARVANLASGGVRLAYRVEFLPDHVKAALARGAAVLAPAPVQIGASPRIETLKDHQRSRLEARAVILAHLDQMIATFGVSRAKAVEAVVAHARAGTLPPPIQSQVLVANARSNEARSLTRATLYNWLKARDAAGDVSGLATKALAEAPLPQWGAALLEAYARPSKPNLTEVLDNWNAGGAAGKPAPSYDQARRFLKRLDTVTRHRGRLGPRALKAMQAYIIRDVSNLWPGAVFIGDGHTFKAEVAHPLHGRPFRPEVTAILDVFTRRWVGWSVALAENTWAVADALRHAVTSATCCDVFYYDNGAGAKNANWDEAVTGFVARLGITKLHSAPWSSQARGVIERFNSSVLHKAARSLPTYVGQRMDKEARQAAFKITRRAILERSASALLIGWDDFKAMLDQAQAHYNATPHSFLSRIIDRTTGKRRHQSPDDAWEAAVAAGWKPEPIAQAEAIDLFRPAVTRTVSRATVKLFNNTYFHEALEALHGETVTVGFDLHDAKSVIVRLMDGRFVCHATWNANSRDYVPVAFAERARDKRIEGRLKRLDAHRDEALAEGTPNLALVARAAPEATPLTPSQEAALNEIEAGIATPAALIDPEDEKNRRIRRALELEARAASGEGLAETDAAWLKRYANTPEYRTAKLMLESFGESYLSG